MRILGIDPGSRITGYGVIDNEKNTSRYIDSGCIRTQSKDFPQRLGEIYQGIQAVITEHQPQQVSVEQVFMAKNAASALKLGHARGAAITAAVTLDIPVFEYTARAVKKALVGTGAAEKKQVQHMVRILLSMQAQTQKMGLDESDALGIALCHAHSHTPLGKLEQLS